MLLAVPTVAVCCVLPTLLAGGGLAGALVAIRAESQAWLAFAVLAAGVGLAYLIIVRRKSPILRRRVQHPSEGRSDGMTGQRAEAPSGRSPDGPDPSQRSGSR